MPTQTKDLWSLVQFRPEVDPNELADAIQDELARGEPDFRTRLLIRDSLEALKQNWAQEKLEKWLTRSPLRDRIQSIWHEDLGEAGFPSLTERIVEKTNPEDVRQYLRELGADLHTSTRLVVGGSIALILPGYLSRSTEDVDVVNEVPEKIRSQQRVLNDLRKRYGLQLSHFQSHYLPLGWDQRIHSLGSFGQLSVFLVDVYDVFLSKLFSARAKDRDDLRALLPQLSKETLVRRLLETTQPFRQDETFRQHAEKNWYILLGEPLPSETPTEPT